MSENNRRPEWQSGSLSTHDVKGVAIDALADLWADGARMGDRNSQFQINWFREQVEDCIRVATGRPMTVRYN